MNQESVFSKTRNRILFKALGLMLILALLATSMMPAAYADDEVTGSAANDTSATDTSATETSESETSGTDSDTTESETTEPEEEEPAPVVPQISVVIKGKGLCVKWDKLEGAKSYLVYRSYKKNSGWKLMKKGITGTYYHDKKVKSGKKAYYKVRALKSDGSYTGYSKILSGTIHRVYVETGHGIDIKGKWDPGCTWGKYQEAKLMLPICKSATKYLRAKGIYVYTDAFSNNNKNRDWTIKFVKKHDVSVFLNVHCDYQYAPKGTMPLYRYSDQKKLAKYLNKGVHKYVKINNRGLKKRKDLQTLNKTKKYCTTCLIEVGNIKKDNKILRTQYDAIGKGLAKGVCDYLGVKW